MYFYQKLKKQAVAETTFKRSDIFISYGRAESKHFAAKLHDRLTEKGMDVWFDQNDIPLGIDFIAPHSIKSEYCLKEILIAIKHSKRIIPILHIEPQEKEVWNNP